MSSSEKLGRRVQNYREGLGMSIEDLSDNIGLDPALIERIENGESHPAIGVMVRLARGLGQRLGTFMDDQYVQDPLVIRRDDRREEEISHGGGTAHYRYFSLGKGKTDRHMEPFFVVVEPDEGGPMSSHEGEEFILVLSGRVKLLYGRDTYILEEGDTTYYNSLVPHHLGAAGEETAEIFAAVYTPF
ncbi:MAG: helix-turn-helix domain-containing protein [Thermoplasmatota archaeon]